MVLDLEAKMMILGAPTLSRLRSLESKARIRMFFGTTYIELDAKKNAMPQAGLIRSSSYYHLKSGAQIDIDLVARPGGGAQPLYWIRVFGWKRI